jgi:hypothetical protein
MLAYISRLEGGIVIHVARLDGWNSFMAREGNDEYSFMAGARERRSHKSAKSPMKDYHNK